MTCKKAQGYLERVDSTVKETADCGKVKIGRDEALKLLDGMDKLVAAKGKKVDILQLKDNPGEEEVIGLLLGPTGNLRAPTAKVGKTLLVGFNEEAYSAVVGQ